MPTPPSESSNPGTDVLAASHFRALLPQICPGQINDGGHRRRRIEVAGPSTAFLDALAGHATDLRPDTDESLPAEGRVVLRALTYDGPMTYEAAEDDLGYGRSPLSAVFHAAHEVIGQLRELDERASAGG